MDSMDSTDERIESADDQSTSFLMFHSLERQSILTRLPETELKPEIAEDIDIGRRRSARTLTQTSQERAPQTWTATSVKDVFPQLQPKWVWENSSQVCTNCKNIGIWHGRLHMYPGGRSHDVLISKDCGNCQLMLACLQKAPFKDVQSQLRKARILRLQDHSSYQLKINFTGGQKDCLLELKVQFPIWKSLAGPGRSASDKVAEASSPTQSFPLASCPLVFCHGDVQNIDRDSSSIGPMTLIKQWLKECQNHKDCPEQLESALPTRVIRVPISKDTNPSIMTSSGAIGKYVALSHCWGRNVPLITTQETLLIYQKEIVAESLPKTFRDAINLTRELGMEYLWIDSLCIIQDSVEDWAQECSKMAGVYMRATLVVAAAAAANSTQGLFSPRDILRGPYLDDVGSLYLRERVTSRKAQLTSPLASRAWAYQEGLLAPRLLLYNEHQMSWECRQGTKDEGVNIVVSSNNSCSKKAFYESIERLSSASTARKSISHGRESVMRNICNRLDTWYACVEDYSHRQLTQQDDKLPALSGLATAIQNPALGEYLAGIWSKDLGTGLFWARHTAREELFGRPFFKYGRYRAPSWTWASHEGPVNFRVQQDISSRPAIASDVTFGRNSGEYIPKLVEHNILLATSDIYGRVLPGSSITLEGYWRKIKRFNLVHTQTHRSWLSQELPRPQRGGIVNDGSFDIRRDHPQGLQEKYIWAKPDDISAHYVLLRFPSNRCLMLTSAGDQKWKRAGCCILPSDDHIQNALYSWNKSTFVII